MLPAVAGRTENALRRYPIMQRSAFRPTHTGDWSPLSSGWSSSFGNYRERVELGDSMVNSTLFAHGEDPIATFGRPGAYQNSTTDFFGAANRYTGGSPPLHTTWPQWASRRGPCSISATRAKGGTPLGSKGGAKVQCFVPLSAHNTTFLRKDANCPPATQPPQKEVQCTTH